MRTLAATSWYACCFTTMYMYVCSCLAAANPNNVTGGHQTAQSALHQSSARIHIRSVPQYMVIANTGTRVNWLSEMAFVASFRNSGARMREPRDRNMNENETITRRRYTAFPFITQMSH
jgi:hypothetical protein